MVSATRCCIGRDSVQGAGPKEVSNRNDSRFRGPTLDTNDMFHDMSTFSTLSYVSRYVCHDIPQENRPLSTNERDCDPCHGHTMARMDFKNIKIDYTKFGCIS
jgi:hypothetical protein